jgi:hypothetical protein
VVATYLFGYFQLKTHFFEEVNKNDRLW